MKLNQFTGLRSACAVFAMAFSLVGPSALAQDFQTEFYNPNNGYFYKLLPYEKDQDDAQRAAERLGGNLFDDYKDYNRSWLAHQFIPNVFPNGTGEAMWFGMQQRQGVSQGQAVTHADYRAFSGRRIPDTQYPIPKYRADWCTTGGQHEPNNGNLSSSPRQEGVTWGAPVGEFRCAGLVGRWFDIEKRNDPSGYRDQHGNLMGFTGVAKYRSRDVGCTNLPINPMMTYVPQSVQLGSQLNVDIVLHPTASIILVGSVMASPIPSVWQGIPIGGQNACRVFLNPDPGTWINLGNMRQLSPGMSDTISLTLPQDITLLAGSVMIQIMGYDLLTGKQYFSRGYPVEIDP